MGLVRGRATSLMQHLWLQRRLGNPTETVVDLVWMAMDGNASTFWDPRGTPATYPCFQRSYIYRCGIVSWGDTTHDIKNFR